MAKQMSVGGKLVWIEGIDGSGKSTQAILFAEMLRKDGKEASTYNVSEPEGGEEKNKISKFIRNELLGDEDFPNEIRQHVFILERFYQYMKNISQLLERGATVVSDRSYWSTYAYNIGMQLLNVEGAGNIKNASEKELREAAAGVWNNSKELKRIKMAQELVYVVPEPYCVFYLDISAVDAFKRKEAMAGKKDLYENLERMTAIEAAYKLLVKNRIGVGDGRIVVIDATQAKEKVTADMMSAWERIVGEDHK